MGPRILSPLSLRPSAPDGRVNPRTIHSTTLREYAIQLARVTGLVHDKFEGCKPPVDIAQAPTAAVSMQVNSATGVVTVSYEPPAGSSQQPHQEAGCSGCRQKRDSHRAAVVGASVGGLVLLLVVAGGDPNPIPSIGHAVSSPSPRGGCLTIEPSHLPMRGLDMCDNGHVCITTTSPLRLCPIPHPIPISSLKSDLSIVTRVRCAIGCFHHLKGVHQRSGGWTGGAPPSTFRRSGGALRRRSKEGRAATSTQLLRVRDCG